MKQPLVSIIVPIYNIEKHLQRCVDSIVNQTYTNVEIILVDDGSTDGSKDVIESNAKKDSRIKTVHQTNGGVSSARNAGLVKATGDYVMFVDADDVIDPETCEECVNGIDQNEDIVYFSVRRVNELGEGSVKEGGIDGSIERLSGKRQLVEYYLRKEDLRIVACILKRSKIGNLRFDTAMRIHEDAVFAFRFLVAAETAVVINKPMYSYISRPGSAMKAFQRSDIDDIKHHCRVVTDFMSSEYPDLIDKTNVRLMPILFNLLTVAKSVSDRTAVIDARRDIRKTLHSTPKNYKMLRRHKLKYLLSYLPTGIFNFVLYRARKTRKTI